MTLGLDSLFTTDSLLSRLDPRWKLGALTFLGAVAVLLHNLIPASLALGLAFILATLGRLPCKWYLAHLGFLLPFLGLAILMFPFLIPDPNPWLLGPIPLSPKGMRLALLLCLKALTVATLMLVLLATGPIQATLLAAQSLGGPRILVMIALLTYRYLHLLARELARVRVALRVRGFRNRATWHGYRIIGHVAGSLLVRSSDRAERVSQAMRSRGFQGQFHSLAEFRTTWKDLLHFFLILAWAVGLFLLDRLAH